MVNQGIIKQKTKIGNICEICGMHLQEIHLESKNPKRDNDPLTKGWKHMLSIGEWCIQCEILWREK